MMKNNKINYVVVGAFVLAMLGSAIVAIGMISGRGGASDPYYTSYSDVSGIKFGTKVLYMGFPVGQVERISPTWDAADNISFELQLAIDRGWRGRIPDDSIAEIRAAGLLAAVTVDIRGGKSKSGLEPGSIIMGRERVDLFTAMSDTANTIKDLTVNDIKPLITNVRGYIDSFGSSLESDGVSLIRNLNSLAAHLDEHAPEVVSNFLELSRELTDTARRLKVILGPANSERIDRILVNTEQATANVAELTSDERVDATLSNIKEASASLATLTNNANRRLGALLGEETVSRVRTSLDNIAEAARNVAQLSRDLRSTRDKLEHFIDTLDKIAVENRPDIKQSVKDLRHTMQTIARHIVPISRNLDGTSRNMYEFSRQIRQNPGALLGGTPPADTATAAP